MNTRLLREFIRSSIHIGKLNESDDYQSIPTAALDRAVSFLVNKSGGVGIGTGKLRSIMDSREASLTDTWVSSLGVLISDANDYDESNNPALVPGGTALLCCHVIATGDYNNAMWALGGIIGVLGKIPGISNPLDNTSGATAIKEGSVGFIDKTFTKFGSASKTALEQSLIVMKKLIASDDTALDTIKTNSADVGFDASKISVKPLKYSDSGTLETVGNSILLPLAFKDTMTRTWHPEVSDELQTCMNAYNKLYSMEAPAGTAANLKEFSQVSEDNLKRIARALDDQFEFYSLDDQSLEIINLQNLQREADAVSRKTTADIEKLSTPAAIKDLVDTMIRSKDFVGSMIPIRYSSAAARAAKTSKKVGKITSVLGGATAAAVGSLDALYDIISEPRFENFNAVCQDFLYTMKADAQMLENEINDMDPLRHDAVRQKLADLQAYSLD
jgi:hypothetical protein